MRHAAILALALLAAPGLAAPALAQPRGSDLTPHGQGGAGAIPPVEGQKDAARMAGITPPASRSAEILRDADRALGENNPGLANELLERAATALLNQPGVEARPDGVRSVGPGAAINAAREALAKNDLPGARARIADAQTAIRRADGDTR